MTITKSIDQVGMTITPVMMTITKSINQVGMTITPVMMTITKSPMDYILGKRGPVTKMLQTIDRSFLLSIGFVCNSNHFLLCTKNELLNLNENTFVSPNYYIFVCII